MINKKTNKESSDLRSTILDEISKYKFSSEQGKKVKRFVWEDPTKKVIITKDKTIATTEPKIVTKPQSTEQDLAKPELAKADKPKESTKKRRARKIITKILIGVGVLVVLLVIFYQARLYKTMPGLARALPWPAAYVNGQYLPLSDFLEDVYTLVAFYERAQEVSGTNTDINVDEIENAVADRMVAEAIVLNFTKRNNIIISQDMINSEQAKIASDFGSVAELEGFIEQNYQWNLDQFKNKVIGPYLRRQEIAVWFQQNSSAQEAAVDNINKIYGEISNGMPFEEAAQKYSQDETNALYGGYLGVFEEGVMVPEFEQVLLSLGIGEISKPVQTIFGWHIIRRETLPTDQSYQNSDLAASHILVKVFVFDKWLEEEKAKSTVWMFLNLPKIKN